MGRLTLFSWALYDLANTSFSLGIVSLYYPLWIHAFMGGRDSPYAITASAVSFAVLFTAPLLGRLSDRYPYPKRFLFLFTFLCILLTLFLGFVPPLLSLLLFGLAFYSYQISLIYYDLLLSRISSEEVRVRAGGIGVGVGYLGSLLVIAIGEIVVFDEDPRSFKVMFLLVALIFLIFSLPLFLWVRERRGVLSEKPTTPLFTRIHEILLPPLLRESSILRRFFLMRILYAEAANTVILFLGIYAREEGGLNPSEIHTLLFFSILSAILGGFLWGEIGQRITPRLALRYVLILWVFALLLVAGSSHTFWARPALYASGVLIGLGLSGIYSCDRPWLFSLVPEPRYGEAFGIYAVSGRIGAIFGPLLYGALSDWAGRPFGVFALAILVGISLPFLSFIPPRYP